jgi:nitrite reductase/ring-hydroxylating ferredoxin subunit
MSTVSKIRFFFISITLPLLLFSCKKNENDVIPDVYIDFTINLNDPEFVSLTSILGSVYVDASTNNWGRKAAGYDDNGIIVFAGAEEFYAYDRTCPHDYAVNGLSIKVNIDFTMAICPRCSTTYVLSSGGTPYSGIGRYPLKNYKTRYYSNTVNVWNY